MIKGQKCAIILAFFLALCSCSPRIVEHIIVQHDTTRVVKIDSLWQYQKDSVFIKEKGDTVYKYVEHIRYRDRVKIDTLVKERVDSVVYTKEVLVEKQLTAMEKAKQESFWWLILAVGLLLLWTFRKPILKLIKI